MEEKLIFSSSNMVTIDHICLALKENDIPFTKKIEGAGDYFAIVAGNTFNTEIQIFVSDENYEKATELINTINKTNESKLAEETPDELKYISPDEEKEMEDMVDKKKNI